MTVRIKGSSTNVRESVISATNTPLSIAGQAMASAATPRDQFNLINAGRKNLIINGDMRIAQRSVSETGLTTEAYTTVDRFGYNMFNTGSCVRTDTQESTGGPPGFPYSKKMKYTTAQSTNANTRQQIRYMVEGYDMGGLAWGTQQAKPVTLSFWVKSNVPGKHAFNAHNQSETETFVINYEVKVPDQWEFVVINIPGPNTGNWNDDERIGIRLAWDTGSGSDYEAQEEHGGRWTTQWKYRLPSSSRLAEVTNGFIQLTGIQLEVGNIATPFEHRSFGDELRMCRRYYEFSAYPAHTVDDWVTPSNYYDHIQFRQTITTNDIKMYVPFFETKRDIPTLTILNPATGGAGAYVIGGGSSYSVGYAGAPGLTENYYPYINTNGNITIDHTVYWAHTAYAEL